MKGSFTTVFFFCLFSALSQTIITGPTVSGTWTLAGSPYTVQAYITVAADQILTIDPGVVVQFMPTTKLVVNGQLNASGTSSLPITFQAADTTGWGNQAITDGGWNGIYYPAYTGPGADQSILQYCTIEDVKYGYNYPVSYCNALSCDRSLKVLYCTFRHNHAGTSGYVADGTLFLNTYNATDTIEINHCTITGNTGVFGILRTANYFGGCTEVLNSDFYDNQLGSTIWGIWNNLLIENNTVHGNVMQDDSAPIKVSIGNVTIRGNKVYENECDQLAAIGCRSGKVTIENNLICNNIQNDAFCGATGGGGGIHLAHNEGGAPFEDTYYIVRNNIIANNYSAYGGGGIYVYNARATISNNDIVNNFTPSLGKSMLILSPSSQVHIRNNLFYAISNTGVVDTSQIVVVLSANEISMDYNYMPSTYSKAMYGSGFIFTGDTIHNVIGTTPGMVSPTADNDIETSALTANFSLLASSACINKGDTVGAYTSDLDYAGNNRMIGPIDIGAYEYGTLNAIFENQNEPSSLLVYPNPVPANSFLMIVTPEDNGRIMIEDLQGRTVLEQIVYSKQNALNIGKVSPGIYFVRFRGKVNTAVQIVVN